MKKGEKMSLEQRLLVSKNRKGKNLNNKHTLGKKHRLETILKMKEWHKKNPRKPMLGKKQSPETIARRIKKGKDHYNWKGGISDNRHKVNTLKYKQWVSDVFSRDNWTCQTCGGRGVYLEAHHIKSWAHYSDFRFDVSNGVTLCKECHKLTDNYKGKGNKKR